MTNTPSPTDEDRELIEAAFALLCRKYVQRADERQKGMGLQYTEAETHDLAETIAKFTRDRLESLLSDRAKLQEALRDLAEAARNACDARLHTPLIEALAEADYLALNRSTDHTP